MTKPEMIIALISLLLGIVGTYLAVQKSFRESRKESVNFIKEQVAKEVNLVRDLEHLKRNHTVLSEHLADIEDRLETLERRYQKD